MPDSQTPDSEKLIKAIELLESAITDIAKLAPIIGGAAQSLADIYTKELEKLK